MEFIDQLIEQKQKSLFAVLIDPDKTKKLDQLIPFLQAGLADIVLVGGSSKRHLSTDSLFIQLRRILNIPLIVFPGHPTQISQYADATMILSLIHSNDPDLIIGQLAENSLYILKKLSNSFSVAYMLLNGGTLSTVESLTKTKTINYSDYKSILKYSLAAQLLGFTSIYYEAGSGAKNSVPPEIISELRPLIKKTIFVGGGITTPEQVSKLSEVGTDVIVVGNILETYPDALPELYRASTLVNTEVQ